MVSVLEGTRGEEATNARVVGVTSCQEPATGGVSVGVGVCSASGAENWTDSVASLGTSEVPLAGLTETTVSALGAEPAPPDRGRARRVGAGAIAAMPTPSAAEGDEGDRQTQDRVVRRACARSWRGRVSTPSRTGPRTPNVVCLCSNYQSDPPTRQLPSHSGGFLTPGDGPPPPRRSFVRGDRSPGCRRASRRPRTGRRRRRRLRLPKVETFAEVTSSRHSTKARVIRWSWPTTSSARTSTTVAAIDALLSTVTWVETSWGAARPPGVPVGASPLGELGLDLEPSVHHGREVVGEACRGGPPTERGFDGEHLDGHPVLAGDDRGADVETVEREHAGHLRQQTRPVGSHHGDDRVLDGERGHLGLGRCP